VRSDARPPGRALGVAAPMKTRLALPPVAMAIAAAMTLAITSASSATVGAGCGELGPTRSDDPPFASIRIDALAVDGHVRLYSFGATQTAGATIRLDDIDDLRTIAETPAGQYTCVAPAPSPLRIGVPLTKLGVARIHQRRAVNARGTITLVNGNGVTSTVPFTTTIVDAGLLPRHAPAPCRDQVASPSTVQRGEILGIAVRACQVRTLRVGLVALDGAHRGNIALRRTFTPESPDVLPTTITIGAVQAGKYRLVLLSGDQRLASARQTITVRTNADRRASAKHWSSSPR
jgi:hypothetical protein